MIEYSIESVLWLCVSFLGLILVLGILAWVLIPELSVRESTEKDGSKSDGKSSSTGRRRSRISGVAKNENENISEEQLKYFKAIKKILQEVEIFSQIQSVPTVWPSLSTLRLPNSSTFHLITTLETDQIVEALAKMNLFQPTVGAGKTVSQSQKQKNPALFTRDILQRSWARKTNLPTDPTYENLEDFDIENAEEH